MHGHSRRKAVAVEALADIGDQPTPLGQTLRDVRQRRGFVGERAQEQLLEDEVFWLEETEPAPTPTQPHLVMNWGQELERLVPP